MFKKFYNNTVVSLYLLVLCLLYHHRQHQCQQYQHPHRHLCPSWMLRGTFSTLVTTPGWVEATNYPSEMFDASTRGKVFFCAIFTADHFYVGKKWVEELSTTFHSSCFLSDPSPIIVYPCHSLTNWLTNWLLFSKLDWCNPGDVTQNLSML